MLKTTYLYKFKGKLFEPGKLYSFKYKKWEQDPEPFIMFYNHVSGTHPNTGMLHNYIQAVNLHYVTVAYRKKLVKMIDQLGNVRSGQMNFNKLLVTIPGIQFAFRRYTCASSYISHIKPIESGIVELTKNKAKHAKQLLPKGIKFNDLIGYRRPKNLSAHKKKLKKAAKMTKKKVIKKVKK